MTYDTRLTALNIARECAPSSSLENLIKASMLIERHLSGENVVKITSNKSIKLDFEAKPSSLALYPSDPNFEWSGIAQDIIKLFNNGNTLVCKARQIGMSRLLMEFGAHKSRCGNRILWITHNHRMTDEHKHTVADLGGDISLITFETLRNFDNVLLSLTGLFPGTFYDYTIIDGLAYLPYANETDFLNSVLPISKTVIAVSEPAQERGLFYDLWKNSSSFQKVMLTRFTPLYLAQADTLARSEELRKNMGDRYSSEFECAFRPVKD